MKRLLVLVVLLALCGAAQGLSLTFQNPSDFAEFVASTCSGSCSVSWVESSNGGNSYIQVQELSAPGTAYIRNTDPSPTSYAAATLVGHSMTLGEGYTSIALYDAGGALMHEFQINPTTDGRYEMEIVGGTATIYRDRVPLLSSIVATNPSYVGFGAGRFGSIAGTSIAQWDMLVYGTTENRNIFGSPESGYFLKKDLINPAASGFYYPNGSLAVSSFNMSTQYGFGSSNESRMVQLMEFGNNYVADSFATSAGFMGGSKSWAIADYIINNPSAPYGYYVTTVPGSGEYSEVIPYIAGGASVAFDRTTYARGDTFHITYSVNSGGYWDPLLYTYRVDTLNVFGEVVDTQPVSTQSGIVTGTFSTIDPLGVYYGVLIAEPISGGSDIWMNYDTCELTGFLVLSGVAVYAPNGTPLNGANISINQGTVFDNTTVGFFGNYTTTAAFYSGSVTTINATAPGCYQYVYSFTPQEAKTLNITISLRLLNAAHNGVAIDGVNRDTVYGNPIGSGLTDVIVNTTYSESYSVTPNPWGYYLLDEDDGATLTPGRTYFIHGSGSRYRQTGDQPYPVVAVGI